MTVLVFGALGIAVLGLAFGFAYAMTSSNREMAQFETWAASRCRYDQIQDKERRKRLRLRYRLQSQRRRGL